MRLVDPRNLAPYQELPLAPEEERSLIDNLHNRATRYNRPVTREQEDRWLNRSRIWQAENEWLRANLPTGVVFEHMGVPVMVAGRAPKEIGEMVGPQHAAATCHCAGEGGGLLILILTVPQLRAILEPGFIAPIRDPLLYGEEANHG